MANHKIILEFISKTETGREGLAAYNTAYGHRENSMIKPFVLMTIDEVLLQGHFRTKHFGSSAAGAYQIMEATLKGLKDQMGLSGDEKFDAAMQDRLGLALLYRRKFKSWANYEVSDVAFALELAKEWASFPVLKPGPGSHRYLARGQSYYAGDGLNKSLVKPEEIEALLIEAKSQGVHTPEEIVPVPVRDSWWTRLLGWLRNGR